MKQIRNLLLDCRAALRRADPAFADSALGEKLDDTILELGKAAQPAPEIAEPETRTAQQVALDALRADDVLCEAFGRGFVDYFTRIKQSEQQRFDAAEDKDDFQRREYFGRI